MRKCTKRILKAYTGVFLPILIIAGLVALSGCGNVNVSDSKHTIVHTVALADIHEEIISLCRDAYGTDAEIQACIQDTLKQVLDALQNAPVPTPAPAGF